MAADVSASFFGSLQDVALTLPLQRVEPNVRWISSPRPDGVQQPESEGFQEIIGDARIMMAAMSSQQHCILAWGNALGDHDLCASMHLATPIGKCPIKDLFG
jgi:hypothetical protein